MVHQGGPINVKKKNKKKEQGWKYRRENALLIEVLRNKKEPTAEVFFGIFL